MKRLYRSQADRKIAGICAGFGEYFDIDPNLIRILLVVLAILTGFIPLMLGYLIAWIIIPEEETETSTVESAPSQTKSGEAQS